MNISEIRENTRYPVPFHFAVVSGTPADHASWWSFDDEQELRDRWWKPMAGETVLDIGAAFGSYALPALALGARVIAFSPADFDTELLQENLKLNPDLAQRCLVVRDGLYSRDGWFNPDQCQFTDQPQQTGGGWSGSDNKLTFEQQWLHVRSLDSFLASHPGISRVDWMKLDVEGAELEVLQGAEECLQQYRPKLLIECHEFHDKLIASKILQYLSDLKLGYLADGPYPHCAVSHMFLQVR